jgi:predicted nucleic acid-binding protein
VKTLLDTCVLSELRRPDGDPGVTEAVSELADEDLFLSVLTLGEIARGVELLAAGRKKKALTSWLNGLATQFGNRVLTIDTETARLWGELAARAQKAGEIIPAIDGLLAATALRHGLHVMTRNTRHFEASGALVLDPWQNS